MGDYPSTSPCPHTPPTDADSRSLAPSEMQFTFRSRSPSPVHFGNSRSDRVLPSIERDSGSVSSVVAPTPSTPTQESTAPSLALTPPPSDSRSRDASFDVPYYFSGIDMNKPADRAGSLSTESRTLDPRGHGGSASPLPAVTGHRRSRSSISRPTGDMPTYPSQGPALERPGLPRDRQSAPPTRAAPHDGPSSLDMHDVSHALTDAAHTPGQYLHPSETRAQSAPLLRRSARRSSARGRLPRHEVHEEELPTVRFHDPAFQDAFLGTKRLVGDLEAVLGAGSLHQDPDSVMKGLYEKAKELSGFRCPATRTVGFVGDSGVGEFWTHLLCMPQG